MDQVLLLPPNLEELIDPAHPVRVVHHIIEKIDISDLLSQYPGGGRSSYHPRMLLKVLLYGYLDNVYSSRKLEAAIRTNVHSMWLAGLQRPDHNTLNRFRSQRLGGALKEIFGQVVEMLIEAGQIDLQEAYIDGTKIEANANRYTFVWAKRIKTSKEKIAGQLEELWAYAEGISRQELGKKPPLSYEQIAPELVSATIERINKALDGQRIDATIKQKLRYGQKHWPQNLQKYAEQEKILGDRGSYSKTDPDATFMRMKEDHMKNGQLKPGYNWQISTQHQYILCCTVHQQPSDSTTLEPHVKALEDSLGVLPNTVVADAGYGSEENYALLEDRNITAYIKYNTFAKESSKKFRHNPSRLENLHYNAERDCFYCPMGQAMLPIGTRRAKTSTGYQQQVTLYQAGNCSGCPLRGACHKQKTDRIIQVNHRLRHYRNAARERLQSPRGLAYRSKRPVDVEPVFGMIKHNRGFRRLLLRGIDKVDTELRLLALAHNLTKWARNCDDSGLKITTLRFITECLVPRVILKHKMSGSELKVNWWLVRIPEN